MADPIITPQKQSRVLQKLKNTLEDYKTLTGYQAVVITIDPNALKNYFSCYGSEPLQSVINQYQNAIVESVKSTYQHNHLIRQQTDDNSHQTELPHLIFKGIPIPIKKLKVAQLRSFIPKVIKCSTNKHKVRWGFDGSKPIWWPDDVPWANIRKDMRTKDQKAKMSWIEALQKIVIECYKFHGREDLLSPSILIPMDNSVAQLTDDIPILIHPLQFVEGTVQENTIDIQISGEADRFLVSNNQNLFMIPDQTATT